MPVRLKLEVLMVSKFGEELVEVPGPYQGTNFLVAITTADSGEKAVGNGGCIAGVVKVRETSATHALQGPVQYWYFLVSRIHMRSVSLREAYMQSAVVRRGLMILLPRSLHEDGLRTERYRLTAALLYVACV